MASARTTPAVLAAALNPLGSTSGCAPLRPGLVSACLDFGHRGSALRFGPAFRPYAFTLRGSAPLHTRPQARSATTALAGAPPYSSNLPFSPFISLKRRSGATKSLGWLGIASVAISCSSDRSEEPETEETVRALQRAVDLDPRDGVVEIDLVAAAGVAEFTPGTQTSILGYHGGDGLPTVPGPLIEATVGDRLVVHFANEMDDGQSYGACGCGAGSAGSDSSDPSTTSDSSNGSTPAGGSSTAGGSTGGDDTDSAGGCEPGTVAACDCPDGPGFAPCSDAGEGGACECCVGEHPLVEGDTRYCEPGGCYCGDPQMDPPLDACYVAAVADVCCPIELVCYE